MALADPIITKLMEAREEVLATGQTILQIAAQENRELSEEEEAQLAEIKADAEKRDGKIKELQDFKIEQDKALEARKEFSDVLKSPAAPIRVSRPEAVYRQGGSFGFYADLYAAHKGNFGAMQRLDRHNMQMENQREEYRSWAGGVTQLETRDGTTGATSFGSFIPPQWLLDEVAERARTGRVVPNMIRDAGAPGSTSITIPRVTTGASTAIQASENVALSETDAITAQLTRTTSTIGGIQDVSVQSVELSPYDVDRFIFGDLIADYNRALDSQCIIGTGASGQLLGLDTLTGVNAVTYTDATPTVGELYPKIADAVQQVHTGRFAPADAILLHPRRWGWFLAALDTSNRPLVTPYAPMNVIAAPGQIASFGPVGSMHGLPVYTDANIPTTLGAGTNEDEIYVANFNDMLLMEGPLRSEVFRDVGSATATVRFRVYSFCNLFVGRFPAGVSRITGTGLVAPTF